MRVFLLKKLPTVRQQVKVTHQVPQILIKKPDLTSLDFKLLIKHSLGHEPFFKVSKRLIARHLNHHLNLSLLISHLFQIDFIQNVLSPLILCKSLQHLSLHVVQSGFTP